MMKWTDTYPAQFLVEHMNCIPSRLPAAAQKAMPYWNGKNPVTLRCALAMLGGEFELLCQRKGLDATLIARVAFGIAPDSELGYERMVDFMDAAEAVRKTRAIVEKESSNARIVYERMYGDKEDVDNIVSFPKGGDA